MHYSKIRRYDTANGKGIRTTLFVSGCTHECKGCFNKVAQSFTYGKLWTKEDEDMFIEYVKDEKVVGVNILGGEPMQQITDLGLIFLLYRIKKETGKSIWLWSGYTYEQIMANDQRKRLLEFVDVLIDGRFIEPLKDLKLMYRGSSNQRVIDVPASKLKGEIILYEE